MGEGLEKRPRPDESKWKIEKRELINQNRWYSYAHDQGKREDGSDFEYFYIQSEHGVGVVALHEGKLILVRQYRYPTAHDSLEVPGGSATSGEPIEAIAKRELLEETGYEPESISKIGQFDVASGYSNEIASVFFAPNCKKVGDQQLEDTEKGMRVELIPVEEVYQMVQDGKIHDGFTLSALMLAWPYLL